MTAARSAVQHLEFAVSRATANSAVAANTRAFATIALANAHAGWRDLGLHVTPPIDEGVPRPDLAATASHLNIAATAAAGGRGPAPEPESQAVPGSIDADPVGVASVGTLLEGPHDPSHGAPVAEMHTLDLGMHSFDMGGHVPL